jgi:hypothetical protein
LALWWEPFKGIRVSGLWLPGDNLLQPPAESRRWGLPEMKKKSVKTGAEGGKHLAALETTRWGDMLSLVEHCAVTRYDDGDARTPGWITIKTSGAAWLVQVKDPDSASSFTAVAETLDKALETAALLLACDEAPWEPDRWLLAQQSGKRKK